MSSIPPLRGTQLPPSQFSPQQDLKELLESIEQVAGQMTQNRGKTEFLTFLRNDYLQTLQQMEPLVHKLPVSAEQSFRTHLQDLKTQMKRLFDTLIKGQSYETIQLDSVTVSTILSLLRNDIRLF